MSRPHKAAQNWLLVLVVIVLAIAPLIFVRGGKFSGSDDQASQAITTLNPTYKPWFHSLLVPASSEVESLLFATQAALGAGTVGYIIGVYQGRSQARSITSKKASKNEHSV